MCFCVWVVRCLEWAWLWLCVVCCTAWVSHTTITTRGWVVSSTARPHFTPGKDPVPILQEVGWAPGPVWTGGKSHPHWNSIPDRPASSQSLCRLSYPAHLHLKYSLFISDFNGTWNFSTNVRNTDIKFHENASSWSRVVPWGLTEWRTDGQSHDEANIRFSQFCDRI